MDRSDIIIKTSIKGIIVNVVLSAFKAVVGAAAGSIAIILDAVNNLTDALSSVITIVGTKLSGRAPDKKHPHGYGRIEYFTSVIIASIVLAAGVTAAKESVMKIIDPGEVDYSVLSLVIVAVAVAVKFFFGRYVKSVGKKVDSGSLIASGEDAFMDSILSLATLAAALANYIWGFKLEGVLGVIIAGFIIKAAIGMLKETADTLLGERADDELVAKLKEHIASFDEVQGVYDMDLHDYGPAKTVGSVHIQVRDGMTAEEIHILTRRIEYSVYELFHIIITMGIYAANDSGSAGGIRSFLEELVKRYDSILEMHGFYVDEKTATVYFDLIFDFEEKEKYRILKEMTAALTERFPGYVFSPILDSDISG